MLSSFGESQGGSRLLSIPANRIVLRGMIVHPVGVETACFACRERFSETRLASIKIIEFSKRDRSAETPLLLGLVVAEGVVRHVLKKRLGRARPSVRARPIVRRRGRAEALPR